MIEMFYHTVKRRKSSMMWILGDHLKILTVTRGLRNYYILHDTINNKEENIKFLLFLFSSPFCIHTYSH